MGDPSRTRIVLADDHAVVRAGLGALLEADSRYQVVGEAGDLAEVRARVAELVPDLVVLDVSMGAESGLVVVPELVAARPALRIVVLTMHDDPAVAREALSRGAHGFVLKEAAAQELVRALDTVMAGGIYLLPALGARMAREPEGVERLTGREREVLRLLVKGHTNAEVAAELFVSLRTVEAHRAGLRARLGATTRAELIEAARTLGFGR